MTLVPGDAPDCEFYGEGSLPLTDLSGWGTNLTEDGSVAIETSSTRGNHPTHRTVDLLLEMSNANFGTCFQYGDNALEISGTDIDLVVNGSSVLTYTIQNIDGSNANYLVSWATEPNPLTTGASDRSRSELWIYNFDEDTWEHEVVTHAQQASSTEDLVFGGSAPSTDVFDGVISGARLSAGFHSSTETAETFVNTTPAPTLVGETRLEVPVPTRDTGIGDDGMPAGPIEAMVAKAIRSNDLLMAGAIVDEVCTGDWGESSTWTMNDPASSSYVMHLEFLRRRQVPVSCNRLRVRVLVQQDGDGAEELSIRAYSANAPGPISKPANSPEDYVVYSVTEERTADDGTGDTGGAWLTIGTTRVARDKTGCTYVWLGWDLGSLNDVRIRAWKVEPFVDSDPSGPVSGGGFGS